MADLPAPDPSPDEARLLHQRLLEADPTAPIDLAAAYLEPLVTWLGEHNRGVPSEFLIEAAEDAILALIRKPNTYRPDLQTLVAYLRLSAQGDLRNALRRERRHHEHRSPWAAVELSSEGGKYLGWDDDPSLPLQIAEQQPQAEHSVPASVRRGLTDAEMRVLELMLRGERKTSAYAEAYGIAHLPPPEQRKEVKRVKDRLKKRWQRAGGIDEPLP